MLAGSSVEDQTTLSSQHLLDHDRCHVRPSVGATFATLQAVGDELHNVFDCPRFGAIRAQYSNLFQDAEGSMRLFMWHKDQKAVSHCLTAILQMAQT